MVHFIVTIDNVLGSQMCGMDELDSNVTAALVTIFA
jgi:hypothetical protein